MTRLRRKILVGVMVATVAVAVVVGVRVLVVRRAARRDRRSAARVIPVTVRPAKRREFFQRVRLAGNVQAKDHALVSARVPGTLDAVFVDEGDAVRAGETRLFQTDPVKLAKAAEVAERQLAVADCTVRERRANLEKVRADFDKAKVDHHRFRQLYEDRGAVTADDFEQKQLRYREATASVAHAEALLSLAVEQRRQAESQLGIARKDLADSLVTAPLTGVVTERRLEPGEMAAEGAVVLAMENPSLLEVSCRVPAAHFGRVEAGQTEMRCRINGVEFTEVVSYVSPTVDRLLRTFETRCLIANPPPPVAAGLMAGVELILDRREGLGAPREAVLARIDGAVVFVADGDRASEVKVKTGWTSDGFVEILEGLDESAPVVTMGQFLLRDGAAVKIVEGR